MPGSTGNRAAELFDSDRLLCAESVLAAMAERLGIKSQLIPRIATGFCSGFSRTCGPCGALTGAVMGMGVGTGRDTCEDSLAPCYACVQELRERFLEKHGSMDCRTLTGCDFGTDKGRKDFKDKQLGDTLCRGLVRDAAETAMTILLENGFAE